MSLDIRQKTLTRAALHEYAAIPIAFAVDRILEVRLAEGGLGGMSLTVTAAGVGRGGRGRSRASGRDEAAVRRKEEIVAIATIKSVWIGDGGRG